MAPNPLLTAADHVASLANAPTQQTGRMLPELFSTGLGTPGWDVMAAQAQIDAPVEQQWPWSVRTYEAMRRDSQIQGLLTSVFLPIRHMDWYVDPADSPQGAAAEIAEDLGLPLLGAPPVVDGVGIDFDDHLRLALLALAIGHQFFEETGAIVGTGSGMRYRLQSLLQYPPHTIGRINIHSNGDLRSVQQTTVPEWPEVAADRLLPYVWDREGANWAGRPLLTGIYKNWVAKDELVRANVVAVRRFSGIPIVETTEQGVGEQAQRAAAQMAIALQSGDGAGASTPWGQRLRLMGVEGSLPDAIGAIRYHDEQMARAFMQMFAELGKTQSGSRALGATLMDHYALGVLAIAKWVRKSLMVLVRRITDRNYGPAASAPQIGFRQDDHEDITMTDLVAAIDAGLITVDDDLEAQARDRANLVARNKAQPARALPKAAPAPAGPEPGEPPVPIAAAAPTVPDHLANTGVDFAALQASYTTAVARLKRQWADVTAQQIDSLVAQIQSATNAADLATITVPAAGVAILLAELTEVMHDGAASARAEASRQGVTLPDLDLAGSLTVVTDRATATAELLATSLAQSAASRAVSLNSADVTADHLATQVRTHLEGLAGQTLDYELAGAVTHAQNEGRFAVMDQAPDGSRIYASELNDSHECALCAEIDDTEYPNMVEARRDYGSGHYVGCLGSNRCRGTLVTVYGED